jgi:hypothetical protein
MRFGKVNYLNHLIIGMVYLGLYILNLKTEIDHIDRNTLNNNVNNLRIVTSQQNKFNAVDKGYSWRNDCKCWRVRITVNGKYVYSKYWKNEEDAAADYIKQKEKYHIISYNDTS